MVAACPLLQPTTSTAVAFCNIIIRTIIIAIYFLLSGGLYLKFVSWADNIIYYYYYCFRVDRLHGRLHLRRHSSNTTTLASLKVPILLYYYDILLLGNCSSRYTSCTLYRVIRWEGSLLFFFWLVINIIFKYLSDFWNFYISTDKGYFFVGFLVF